MTLSMNTFRPSLWSYLLSMLLSPRRAFAWLMQDPERLRYGLGAIGLKAGLYTLIVLLLYLGNVPIMIPAWLAIPVESYYFWQTFFIAAVTLGCWILSAGVVQLLSKAAGGTGSFEDVLAALAFAITLPSFATVIPDFLVGLLATFGLLDPQEWAQISVTPGLWRTVIWSYLGLYLVGLFVLFPVATAAAQKLRGLSAIGIGLVGVVVYQGVYFNFHSLRGG